MELVEVGTQIDFPKLHLVGQGNFKKSFKPSAGLPSMTATVVAMTNSKAIQAGDLLCLPYFSKAEK